MAIQFKTTNGPVTGYAVVDGADHRERFDTPALAQIRANAVLAQGVLLEGAALTGDPDVDEEFYEVRVVPTHEFPSPMVECSSEHAELVCDVLGLSMWEGDPLPPEEFLRRINALGPVDPDPGTPGESTARWHDSGRRPGYLEWQLGRLRELAEFAIEHGREFVYWS